MIDWLSREWASFTGLEIAAIVIGFVLTVVISYVVVSIILIKLPENYFKSDYEYHFFSNRHPVLRGAAHVVKNILGVLLILAGIVLSLPGIPGPGLVTIVIGIMLTDVPGKKKLETKIIKRPSILAAINKLRVKYGKPKLVLDQ